MKGRFISLLFLSPLQICQLQIQAQCFSHSLTTQAQVDSFSSDYGCTVIEGSLSISGADVTHLTGLSGLTQVGGLYISFTSLQNLSGLEQLQSIEGQLNLYENSQLTSLQGLNNLTTVGSIDIRIHLVLTDISALANLTHTDMTDDLNPGDLVIRDCPALPSLNGLHNITTVNGYLWIEHNASLQDLTGLMKLHTVTNTMWLNDNDALLDLSGLENLTSVPRLGVVEHENLATLNGLQGLTNIPMGLIISNNTSLQNLLGLEYITIVGQELYINDNVALTSLLGLSSLASVGGDPMVTAHYPDGLSLIRNKALTQLIGLESLQSISAALLVSDMDGLTDLTGLEGLESVGGNFSIRFNDNLESLRGLSSLSAIGRDLTISSNSKLSDCAIQAVCDYLMQPPGVVTVSNLIATGCRDQEEILARCSPLREIRLLDANPEFYYSWLGSTNVRDLTPAQLLEADFSRNAIAADGVSEVVLIAEFAQPGTVDFIHLSDPLEKPWGPHTIELNDTHYGFGILKAPEVFPGNEESDKDTSGIHKTVLFVDVAHSGETVTEIDWPITVVRPPVILVHGTFDNPEKCWKTPVEGQKSMYEQLSANGYKVFTLDYSESNGSVAGNSSFDDNSHVLLYNSGGINDVLSFYRDTLKYACTRADVVGHSLGGILPRIYASAHYNSDPGYKRRANFMQGDINRLITIASTHFGSDLGAFKVFLEDQSLYDDPLAWTEGQAAALITSYLTNTATSEAVRDQVPLMPGEQMNALTAIGNTPIPAHAIAGNVQRGQLKDKRYDPDSVYYTTYRYMSLLLYYAGALRDSYVSAKEEWCDEQWSDLGVCPKTAHDGKAVPQLQGLDEDQVFELIKSGVDEVMRVGAQILEIIDKDSIKLPSEIDIFKYFMAEVGMGDFTDPLLQYFVEELSPTEIVSDFVWKKFLKPELEALIDDYLGEEETVQYEEDMLEVLRFLVFNHDENDGTVRVESQLGALGSICAECVTHFENILHSYSPRYPEVQDRVLSLLNGGMTHFAQQGFPAPDRALPFYYPDDRIAVYKPVHTRQEAICQSGMLPSHAEAYARVADRENVIVIVRPVNPDGLDLLENCAATKKMDVKPKSSNWGPQKGYLPVNQRYSKIPEIFIGAERTQKIEAYNIKAQENLTNNITKMRHLQIDIRENPYLVYIDHNRNAGDDDPNIADEVVLVPEADPATVCHWTKPFSTEDVVRDCEPITSAHALEPLYVMASVEELEDDGITHRYLTADYDLLMVGFYQGEDNPYNPPMNIPFQPGVGQITTEQIALVHKLNTEANHPGGDLTHHGPENQFSLSPYIDYPLTVFAPDEYPWPSAGEVLTIWQGPKQFRDILLKRYVNTMRREGYDLYDNPSAPGWKWKWNSDIDGFELADSPALASYIEQFPEFSCDKHNFRPASCEKLPVAQLPSPKGPQGSALPTDLQTHWTLHPNPIVSGEATVSLASGREMLLTITVTDALGIPIHHENINLPAGSHQVELDLHLLQKGLYSLSANGFSSLRFIIL